MDTPVMVFMSLMVGLLQGVQYCRTITRREPSPSLNLTQAVVLVEAFGQSARLFIHNILISWTQKKAKNKSS